MSFTEPPEVPEESKQSETMHGNGALKMAKRRVTLR